MLACLHWLGEFQILACIPLAGSVPIKDIAELSGVPTAQLTRVIRLVATVAFLEEPSDGYVAHTALSARFTSDPSLLDAAMFLAETAAPTALQMSKATTPTGFGDQPTKPTLDSVMSGSERPKLRRQWAAYLQHAGGVQPQDDATDVLAQLHWSSINAQASDGDSAAGIHVVEVGAESVRSCMATSLVGLYPALRIVVQIHDADPTAGVGVAWAAELAGLSPRIAVTTRAPGVRQPVLGAAVYILHLSGPERVILSELHAHLAPLRAGNGIMLIPTPRLLPERGSLADPEAEAVARSRDLTLRQLLNEGEMEMSDLLEKINTVQDAMGKLVVVKKLRSRNNLVAALVVSYQHHGQ